MGIATESSFSILKVKKDNPHIQAKIVTKTKKTKYVDPFQKSPFEQNLPLFFDN